ncbi:MAG: DUF975 family protein [Clostridiaceae bacterium]
MLFASDFRRRAREALSGKWLLAVGTGIVASILGAASDIDKIFDIDIRHTIDTVYSMDDVISIEGIRTVLPIFFGGLSIALFWTLVVYVIGSVIKLGYCKFNIRLINRDGAEFDDLFSYFKIFWNALLLRIITGIYTFLWTLLFIIPGIIAAYRYAMAPYIMAENTSLTAHEAIDRSKEMMSGNKWRLFCLDVSFIGWLILAGLTMGIGFLWLTPYMECARAAFYIDLRGGNGEGPGVEAASFI